MHFIEWSESMSVGIDYLDEEHKIIIDLINLFHQNVSQEAELGVLETTLNTLIDYTEIHFAHEEQMMEVCRYPERVQHTKQHGTLKEQVLEIVGSLHLLKGAQVKNELLTFLGDWLIHHILVEDMHYRPYCENSIAVNLFIEKLKKEDSSKDIKIEMRNYRE